MGSETREMTFHFSRQKNDMLRTSTYQYVPVRAGTYWYGFWDVLRRLTEHCMYTKHDFHVSSQSDQKNMWS